MSNELMYVLITKMHLRLNQLIEQKNYDLLDKDVLHYSQRLDKVLSRFNKVVSQDPNFNLSSCEMKKFTKCAI
ncbi:Spo0E family sporulation regulatory protein-aspartic acid phosphatase [Herbivorax sp. ANBcel31]|uniref:Spo0E family sporulation regulatory protein-aspartic acid phosphatase n=1 Tax=Herbivorax sp. ANBcel31 TaxID=3069754 RepID=UPI0027B8200D|nr:Spo0E family sporulation regulatory protein-aspartic acid phosphatase [Herbivorax sp. ANBcel31]MDQ2087502.1 Spo0E family sporulation regulatory protein-aspartic acid phosphatase [Herbivorax sp. ANBcel31]